MFTVCRGKNCFSSNSKQVLEAFAKNWKGKAYQEVRLVETVVMTFVKMSAGNRYPERHIMSGVTPEDVPEIVEEHLVKVGLLTAIYKTQ